MGLISIDSKSANQRFFQQNLYHCVPIIHPGIIVISFSVVAAYLIIFGAFYFVSSRDLLYYDAVRHANGLGAVQSVSLSNVKANRPINIYYRVPGFYQNVRSYVQSFDLAQLTRTDSLRAAKVDGNCHATSYENAVDFPCGLQYRTIPRDSYAFWFVSEAGAAVGFQPDRREIAWKSDRAQNSYFGPAFKAAAFGDGLSWEDVANWMRPSAFKDAQKLYARITPQQFAPYLTGKTLRLQVQINGTHASAQDPTQIYSKERILVFAQTSALGGPRETRNIAISCLAVGCICAAVALLFAVLMVVLGPRSKKYDTALQQMRVITKNSLKLQEMEDNGDQATRERIKQLKIKYGVI